MHPVGKHKIYLLNVRLAGAAVQRRLESMARREGTDMMTEEEADAVDWAKLWRAMQPRGWRRVTESFWLKIVPHPMRLMFNYRDDCNKALARGETPTGWSEYRRTRNRVRCEFNPRYGLIELGRDIGALITTRRRAEAP